MSTPREEEQSAGRAALTEQHHEHQVREREIHPPEEDIHQFHGNTTFQRWVVHHILALRGDIQAVLAAVQHNTHTIQQMEQIMVANTRSLIAAVAAAETKIDGYVQIINASSLAFQTALAQLASIKDEPTSDEIQNTIDGLTQHLAGVDAAVTHLQSTDKPPAPPATDPQPAPNPASPLIPQTPA